jgi:hypothetical protein
VREKYLRNDSTRPANPQKGILFPHAFQPGHQSSIAQFECVFVFPFHLAFGRRDGESIRDDQNSAFRSIHDERTSSPLWRTIEHYEKRKRNNGVDLSENSAASEVCFAFLALGNVLGNSEEENGKRIGGLVRREKTKKQKLWDFQEKGEGVDLCASFFSFAAKWAGSVERSLQLWNRLRKNLLKISIKIKPFIYCDVSFLFSSSLMTKCFSSASFIFFLS